MGPCVLLLYSSCFFPRVSSSSVCPRDDTLADHVTGVGWWCVVVTGEGPATERPQQGGAGQKQAGGTLSRAPATQPASQGLTAIV